MIILSLALAIPLKQQCHLQVIPDYMLAFTYKAVLRMSSACLPTDTLRIRKSSTLNTKAKGAPYQPIKPVNGAWNLSRYTHDVPSRDLWTLQFPTSWRWEWYDPAAKRWTPAEVLHAGP